MKGQDENEQDIDGTFDSNDVIINFTDNKLQMQANDIDYGVLKFSNVGKPVAGTINGQSSADVLSVSDNRRTKDQAQIYLSQTNDFMSESGNNLPAELRFYAQDGTYKTLSKSGILISDTPAGSTVNSIENNDNVGLKLFVMTSAMKNEQYSTTLNWTIQDAPK